MTLLTWNSACSVGVRAMDDQHGILMDAVNDLRQLLITGAGREKVREELKRIEEFVRMHFASEEQLLELYSYPDLEEHHQVHRRLFHQIQETVQRAERTDEIDFRQLTDFLRHWFLEHIEKFDQHYGEWLNSRGIF